MAETLKVETKCSACGAEVRPGSVFCYNCGGAVSPEAENNNRKDAGKEHLQSDLSENNRFKTTQLKKETFESAADTPIAKPTVGELLEKIEAKPIEKSSIQEEAKMKSAANLRRKAKSFQKKPVEVVWEEPENAPNKWFPIFAVLLILFVVAIFYLAMYMK